MRRKLPGRWRVTKGYDPFLDVFILAMWVIIAGCVVAMIWGMR